jgi:hypothetical protein
MTGRRAGARARSVDLSEKQYQGLGRLGKKLSIFFDRPSRARDPAFPSPRPRPSDLINRMRHRNSTTAKASPIFQVLIPRIGKLTVAAAFLPGFSFFARGSPGL